MLIGTTGNHPSIQDAGKPAIGAWRDDARWKKTLVYFGLPNEAHKDRQMFAFVNTRRLCRVYDKLQLEN